MKTKEKKSDNELMHELKEELKSKFSDYHLGPETFSKVRKHAQDWLDKNGVRTKAIVSNENNSHANLSKGRLNIDVLFLREEKIHKISI